MYYKKLYLIEIELPDDNLKEESVQRYKIAFFKLSTIRRADPLRSREKRLLNKEQGVNHEYTGDTAVEVKFGFQ